MRESNTVLGNGLASSTVDSRAPSGIVTDLSLPVPSGSLVVSGKTTKRLKRMTKEPRRVLSGTVTHRHQRNAKRYGTLKEHECMEQLKACGCEVSRAAGSLGMFDVIAFGRYSALRLIQVKSTRAKKAPSYSADIAAIRAFTNMPEGASKELWICVRGQWEKKML